MVAGPPHLVGPAGTAVAAILGGRGGGRGDRFQGKATNVLAHVQAAAAAEEAIAGL